MAGREPEPAGRRQAPAAVSFTVCGHHRRDGRRAQIADCRDTEMQDSERQWDGICTRCPADNKGNRRGADAGELSAVVSNINQTIRFIEASKKTVQVRTARVHLNVEISPRRRPARRVRPAPHTPVRPVTDTLRGPGLGFSPCSSFQGLPMGGTHEDDFYLSLPLLQPC